MKSHTEAAGHYQSAVRNILELLNQRRVDEAAAACQVLLKTNPESNDALLLLGKARQQQGRFEEMLQLVETALSRAPQMSSLQLQFVGACQFCGHHDRALQELEKVERSARKDAALLQNVAELYVHSGKHEDAHRCYLRAAKLDRKNPRCLYNLASSYVAVGDLRQAAETYSKVIDLDPRNYDAWHNRSTLRKKTRNRNHTAKLEKAIQKLAPDDPGEASLCYALSKELEDLGDNRRSFTYLKRGADSRRRRLQYDVQSEVSFMTRIAALFDGSYAANLTSAPERRGPIFVLGLPRSGTTLVDRIISSHSEVESLGEIPDFALALTRLGRTTDRLRLLEASALVDPDQLGREYLRSAASYGSQSPYFIDKSPTNYLYVGLIAKALPGASIVHVQRHPLDSCFAMYRALFRMGYPFSYDLEDLGEYYIAYDALMRHWRETFPDTVLDVSYEELVDNQERVSNEILDHCGLAWEAACLEFDRNMAPVATASAAQVRKPIYRDALSRWRRFETQLAPLIDRLQAAGIVI